MTTSDSATPQYTAPDDCKYRAERDGISFATHNFQLVATSAGTFRNMALAMACAKCGATFILGNDSRWHQIAFGVTIPDALESGEMA